MASKKNKKISAYLKEKLQHAFNVFDTDHSGALSLDELREVFQRPGGGCPLSDEQVQELFHEFDVNHDGVLEFDEFAAFWTGTLGEAGDDLLYMASKEKKKPAKAGPGVAPAPAKPAVKSASLITRRGKATKTFTLESKTNLDMRLQAELTKQQKYKANAESTSSLTFERKLGAALIRNDKSNVLKAGKLDKYLATLLRSWDKNGDNAVRAHARARNPSSEYVCASATNQTCSLASTLPRRACVSDFDCRVSPGCAQSAHWPQGRQQRNRHPVQGVRR
jgi:hypothetical protein